MVFTFIENALNLCIYTHPPLAHSKLQVEFFKICSPQHRRGGESYDLLHNIKIQSEDMKMSWNTSLFTFFMIFNFSKCEGFTVL